MPTNPKHTHDPHVMPPTLFSFFLCMEVRHGSGVRPVEHRGGQGPATKSPWLRPTPHDAREKKGPETAAARATGAPKIRGVARRGRLYYQTWRRALYNRLRAVLHGPANSGGQRAGRLARAAGAGEKKAGRTQGPAGPSRGDAPPDAGASAGGSCSAAGVVDGSGPASTL